MPRWRKQLSKEDKAVWAQVVDAVDPIAKPAPKVEEPSPSLPPLARPKRQVTAIPAFALGEKAKSSANTHHLKPSISQGLSDRPLAMDRKVHGKVKRGKLEPEARLDLHGLTLARAHPRLVQFILNAQLDGKRLVLVITGKGKDRDDGGPIPMPRGVLRHQVPDWLSMPPCSNAVLQVVPAHLKHGGQGAYYVYLKRLR